MHVFQQKPNYSYFETKKKLYYKCKNLSGWKQYHTCYLCKLRHEKYCFRLIHFCPSLCFQVLFDECERMLHWFSYWFWWHFSVVSRFPWGEGRWTLFEIYCYSSLSAMEGWGCFLSFFSLSPFFLANQLAVYFIYLCWRAWGLLN